jgi:hypothetical protein
VRPKEDQTARTTAPATQCNDVARIGQFRHFAGSMNFETTPRGAMSKREPQIILKTDERSIHLELGRERKFNRQIKRLG